MTKLEQLENNIFSVSNFLSCQESQDFIDLSESQGFGAATINAQGGPILNSQIRNNERYTRDDPELATTIWKRTKEILPIKFKGTTAIALNERFQFYRYDVGQKFDWHLDGHYTPDASTISNFTFMVYLNDDFEGGGTSFVSTSGPNRFPEFTVEPEVGKALFFYHRIEHRGDPVISGRKYVMRSDVMYTRNS